MFKKYIKKIIKNLFFIYSLTSLLIACADNRSIKTQKNGVIYITAPKKTIWKKKTIKKLWEIGEKSDDEYFLFSGIASVTTDLNLNIYVCDSKENCVKIFNKNGTYIRDLGKKGQGPGELLTPIFVEIGSQNKIFIYELGNRRVSIFNKEGKFLSSFSCNFSPSDMVVNQDNNNVFIYKYYSEGGPGSDIKKSIFVYNDSGELLDSFANPSIIGITNIGKNYSRARLKMDRTGKLICALNYPYELKIYYDNELKTVIKKKSDLFSSPKLYQKDNFQMLLTRASVTSLFLLPKGKLMTKIKDYGDDIVEQYKNRWKSKQEGKEINLKFKIHYDVFNQEGDFLYSFSDPFDKGEILHIDHFGIAYVYISFNGIPHLAKYKIDW